MSSEQQPIHELKPWEAARVAGVLTALPALYIFGIEGVTTETEIDLTTGESTSTSDLGTQFGRAAVWLVLTLVAAGVERYTRSHATPWPPRVRALLAVLRLAPAPAVSEPASVGRFELRPYHVARAAAVVAVLLAVFGSAGVFWLLVAGCCLGAEWFTRTRGTGWPGPVREALAESGPAPPREPGAGAPGQRWARTIGAALVSDAAEPLLPARALRLGEIFRTATVVTRRSWRVSVVFTVVTVIVAFMLFFVVTTQVAQIGSSGAEFAGDDPAAGLAFLIGSFLLGYLLTIVVVGVPADAAINGVTVFAADAALRGVPVRLDGVLARVRPRLLALCGLQAVCYALALTISTALPILALLVGGFPALVLAWVLTIPLSFAVGIVIGLAPVVLTLEDIGVGAALRRSVELVRSALGQVVAIHLVWLGIVVVALVTLLLPLGIGLLLPGVQVLVFPVAVLVLAAGFPYFRTLQTVVYADLTRGTRADVRDLPGVSPQESASPAPPVLSASPAPPALPAQAATPTLPVSADALTSPTRPPVPTVSLRKEALAPAASPIAPQAPTVSLRKDAPALPASPVRSASAGLPAPSPLPAAPPPPPTGASRTEEPAASPRPRRGLAAVCAVAVLALLIAAGTAWWQADRPAQDTPPQPEGLLRGIFPAAPQAGWRFPASEVFARAQFWSPRPDPMGSSTPEFLDLGDTLVTLAVLPNTDREPVLVAVDTESGTARWTATGWYDMCATRTTGGLLPCYRSGGFEPEHRSEIVFLRLSDGSIEHTAPAADDLAWLEVVGDDIITASYSRITSGTVHDLTAHWATEWEPDPVCPGSGDSYLYGATDDFVYFGSDAGAIVLRRTDGSRVIAADVQNVAVYPGHGLVAQTCTAKSAGPATAVVLDRTGKQLRTHPGGGVPVPAGSGADGTYLAADGAWDFTTGTRLWSSGTLDSRSKIVDGIVVTVGSSGLGALELGTGSRLWSADIESGTWMSDRQRILVQDYDSRVHAVDLRTGAVDWTMRTRGGRVAPAGAGFAEIDGDALTYYGPTGPPATELETPADEDGSNQVVTRCGRLPELTPVEYRTTGDTLTVRMELRARCATGDILASDALRITITDRGQPIAAGVFDLSTTPLHLPATSSTSNGTTSVQQDFEFPVGTFWRLPNSIGDRPDPSAVRARGGSTQLVECVDQGTNQGPASTRPPATAAAGSYTAAHSGTSPADADRAALDALRAQADADRPSVTRDLADRWVPQLSAKQEGLVAPDVDGRVVTWTPSAILEQHLRLRLRYPEVRLVYSDDWRTFDLRGWWVTLAGVTHRDPGGAKRWCDDKGIAVDECFAKLVSNTRDSRGTTQYR
ncbi:outer membrane protein assembly factor BamB family protein [Nocardia jiangsuensis]|uniref:PQQ-binding-like beta-propeller repeat protein n=1 Tax=Nocardia jiangsuensis TaxID=1691563 RepID=A0ABV8DRA2_9NOCA